LCNAPSQTWESNGKNKKKNLTLELPRLPHFSSFPTEQPGQKPLSVSQVSRGAAVAVAAFAALPAVAVAVAVWPTLIAFLGLPLPQNK